MKRRREVPAQCEMNGVYHLLVIIMALVIAFVAMRNKYNALYPSTMKVVAIDCDTVCVENLNGFQYEFDGAEDYDIGDWCSMIMDDNGTNSILDDKIVTVQYLGH